VGTAAEMHSLALQNHQAGNLQAAEQLYIQVLQADPHHADAIHLLGVLAYQTGRSEQAVALIGQAVALNPRRASYQCNLGLAHESLGHAQEAITHFRAALKIDPHHPEAHGNLAKSLLNQGELDQTVTHCRLALHGRPQFPDALTTLGAALERQGNLREAVAHWQEALRLDPNFAPAHYNLGTALQRQDKIDDAIRCYQEALRLNPELADAWNNLGALLVRQNKFDEAIRCCQHALTLRPLYHEIHHNLGTAFERQDRFGEAIRCYREALRLKPDLADACNNLGSILALEGNLEDGIGLLDKAIDLEPDNALAHWNRAILLLLCGDFERGWADYEWRSAKPGFVRRAFTQPRWDGSPLSGRAILLYADQGLGDTLQFVRYAPILRERGGTVIVECQPALARLLANAAGIDHVAVSGSELPRFDVQAALLNIPGILHTSLATIPRDIPYVHADAALVANWRRELTMSDVQSPISDIEKLSSDIGHRTSDTARVFRVGIAWQGSPTFRHDRRRSIPLAHFARLAPIGGVQLISLQKGLGTEQLSVVSCQLSDNHRAATDNFSVLKLEDRLDEAHGPFMDTAAVMMNVDLVISSDTAVPHLAGALGVPVWVVVPAFPDWRWLLEREDSPWYPSMRLFRQSRAGDWDSVFERIATELKRCADEARRIPTSPSPARLGS
jgi:tetratricopeptide (TPR) repeat protein